MSSQAEVLMHPATAVKEQTWSGFSWPCLFFGVFWFLYKRMWGWAAIAFLAAVCTGGLSWLIFPFFANGIHSKGLLKDGWMSEVRAREFIVSPETHVRCPDCRELVREDARKCKHCGAALVPSAVSV